MTHHHGNPKNECQHELVEDDWTHDGDQGMKYYICIHCGKTFTGDVDANAIPLDVTGLELPL